MRFRENKRVCMFCDITAALVAVMLPLPVIYFASAGYLT